MWGSTPEKQKHVARPVYQGQVGCLVYASCTGMQVSIAAAGQYRIGYVPDT